MNDCAPCARGKRPAFHCGACGRHIAIGSSHWLLFADESREPYGHVRGGSGGSAQRHAAEMASHLTTQDVICAHCTIDTRSLHAKYYPGCDVRWHDLHDHRMSSATHAAAVRILRAARVAAR